MTETCPLCRTNPANTREHIWPSWYLKRLDAIRPPTAWVIGGKPVLNTAGKPLQFKARQRWILNVCTSCNGILNDRFELPAKDPVMALTSSHWAGSHSADEWRTIGTWWAKVLLMLGHTKARIGDDRLNKEVKLAFDEPLPDYTWMINGSEPPEDLALYVYNTDMSPGDKKFNLLIPTSVSHDDGTTTHCHTRTLATQGICVTVVSHPGITIEHPLITRGEAWELLHTPPADADLSALPVHGYHHVATPPGRDVPAGHVVNEGTFSVLGGGFGYETELFDPKTVQGPH